ncbi:MAG: hypothetical protein KAU38_02265, partial [Desulfobacterales bacterium]|nr:hypothetical protein [Desulfobacterales bacterium]
YEDPEYRLQQIILGNFKRGTLSNAESIEKITRILTIRNFWESIEQITGTSAKSLRAQIGELIYRRNQVAHRADRPEEGEESDSLGLRPITLAWTNLRVQAAKTLVTASNDLIGKTISRLEEDIEVAKEQEEARKVVQQLSKEIDNP